MSERTTHREVRQPTITLRYLAEYMAASERKRNSILRDAKYQAVARVVQHDEAKAAVARFIFTGREHAEFLSEEAARLRGRLFETEFEETSNALNADYLDRFVAVQGAIQWPRAEFLAPGRQQSVDVAGVRVSLDLRFRLRRMMARSNRVRHGGGVLRYAKGKPLDRDVAEWSSAFLCAALPPPSDDPHSIAEEQLCLTVDAWSGVAYAAPGNSATRFQNMRAACEAIAQRWPHIAPPPGASL